MQDKQNFLRKVFDDSARFYEGIAKWGWFNSGDRYRKDAFRRAGLRPGMRIVDVAAGTGITARAALSIVGSTDLVTCVEPSAGMIAESRKLLNCEHIQAEAENIPLPDATRDFLSMGFALRHVNDLERAFREYCRVLKPGGTALIMDVTAPKGRLAFWAFKFYFKTLLPFLTRVFTGSKSAEYLMAYYWDTMENMVPNDTVVAQLRAAGFADVKAIVHLGIFTEYVATKGS
jgi:demethylmenaquinone methyltransferase/2-methoxy-6-polyprenyl-1,4-benzoquinol methylase